MGQKGKGGSWHDAGSKERLMGGYELWLRMIGLSLGQELA